MTRTAYMAGLLGGFEEIVGRAPVRRLAGGDQLLLCRVTAGGTVPSGALGAWGVAPGLADAQGGAPAGAAVHGPWAQPGLASWAPQSTLSGWSGLGGRPSSEKAEGSSMSCRPEPEA